MADTSKLVGLNEILKDISKKYGNTVAKYNVEDLGFSDVIPSGSPSLDFSLYGGLPDDRYIEISGPEGSGKTTVAFRYAAEYQRKEIEKHPDNPRAIVMVDNEGTADPVWAKVIGYDMSANALVPTIIIRPEGQSAEQIFDMITAMIKTGEVGMVILDSIATLVPEQIAGKPMTEKDQMGGISKALGRFSNENIGVLRKYKVLFIGINQVRENLSGYGQKEITPGGRAWKHNCSVRLRCKKGDFFDAEGKPLTANAESPAGHIVEIFVAKTKICKWDRKLAYFHLDYNRGIDIVQDTIDVATKFGFVDNSSQGIYKVINEDGTEIKIRGKANFVNYLNEHKEVWKSIYDRCYEKLKQKEDPYIKSFEEMLGINLMERFGIDENTIVEEM